MSGNEEFKIGFLDHVAIRVKDMDVSAEWYERALGLKKYQLKEWGPFPIFMLANKSGLALFPANKTDKPIDQTSKKVSIDHFAFNVTNENFERAKRRYTAMNLEFTIQHHHNFLSMYTKDPEGHNVELTTLIVDEKSFYKP
ncbi:VOC family protein [uncultured Eudoraea sp.]|jgi:catechol 2,3-dioxygenase-like lactoylglutathione lyase family enzyme|uniref:VOC family protein n=1 Tax=uncultured Eudoraea sp. TaxID=1035614 RepID=UPI00261AB8E7|nr:VOC family protein [uncultured Eudoraea sp.]